MQNKKKKKNQYPSLQKLESVVRSGPILPEPTTHLHKLLFINLKIYYSTCV